MDPNGRQRRRGQPVHGWVVLDKPHGLGSTPAVARVRRLLDAAKAGHAGTLDPLADGILPIALGDATKTVPYLVDAPKAYRFTARFGHETTTGDLEGEPTQTSRHIPTATELRAALPAFLGNIEQVPPRYSAVRIDGQRAYARARAGEAITMPSRTVRIDALELESTKADTATFTVACGKGTYVRALARDIARACGSRAHVTHLRRTRVGPFDAASAVTLDALEADPLAALRPIHLAVPHLARTTLTADQAAHLAFGRAFALDHADTAELAVFHDGHIRAIGTVQSGLFQPRRVLRAGTPTP